MRHETRGVDADEIRRRFHDDGLVRLDSAFTRPQADQISGTVWGFVERRTEIRRDDSSTWVTKSAPVSFKPLKGRACFEPILDNDAVTGALDTIPLTPVGKADKRSLRARFWSDEQRSVH